MTKRTCSLPECDRPFVAKGYCQLHYSRAKIHGDPRKSMKGKAHKVRYTSDGLRICKVCSEPKPESEYHKDKTAPDGFRAQCKPCRNGYMAGYYDANRDKRVAYEQDRRLNRTEHMRALDMARYERNKEKRIALACEQVAIRRARLAGVETDKGVTVAELRRRLGDQCCYCAVLMTFERVVSGQRISPNKATLEHVMPISRGGTHTFGNTALACHGCNVSKNAKTVAEWEAWKALRGGASNGREEAAPSSEGRSPGREGPSSEHVQGDPVRDAA